MFMSNIRKQFALELVLYSWIYSQMLNRQAQYTINENTVSYPYDEGNLQWLEMNDDTNFQNSTSVLNVIGDFYFIK